jgi:hypothetical protein
MSKTEALSPLSTLYKPCLTHHRGPFVKARKGIVTVPTHYRTNRNYARKRGLGSSENRLIDIDSELKDEASRT